MPRRYRRSANDILSRLRKFALQSATRRISKSTMRAAILRDFLRLFVLGRSRGSERGAVADSVSRFHRMRDIDNRVPEEVHNFTNRRRFPSEKAFNGTSSRICARSGAEAEAHARARDAIVPCVGCQFISRTSALDATPRRRELFRE